jgi:oxygen-independent coproporphyrinogen-3 oxidase
MTATAAGPLAVYVHFPWCARKCPYCDFNSHPIKGAIPEAEYAAQLIADLTRDTRAVSDRAVSSVFFGGGTPSLISPSTIGRIVDAIHGHLTVTTDVEITLEANPGAIDSGHLRGYAAAGVNRLSIGAQSFDAPTLQRLGRIHGPDEIGRSVAAARKAGITRINLDIMHGLPKQNAEAAVVDLQRALDLDVEHVSWYQLTLEPRTPFAANPPPLPDEPTLAAIEDRGLALLAAAGYERYEVSAFARAGARSRHNLNYWQFGDYLGIGAGAHGKLTFTAGAFQIVRTQKPKAPERYLRTPTELLSRRDIVAPEEVPGEFMLNVLRLTEGVPIDWFEKRTGLSTQVIAVQRAQQIALGLMREDRIALTDLGRRYLDSVVAAFV